MVLEPRLGGRIYERTPDGTEHDWGEVTLWDPPHRFGYLWHLRRDRADATDVEIRFLAATDSATVVEIEHRGWERLGADADGTGWATSGTCVATGPTRPTWRSASWPRHRPYGSRSSTAAGSASAPTPRLAGPQPRGWTTLLPHFIAAAGSAGPRPHQ